VRGKIRFDVSPTPLRERGLRGELEDDRWGDGLQLAAPSGSGRWVEEEHILLAAEVEGTPVEGVFLWPGDEIVLRAGTRFHVCTERRTRGGPRGGMPSSWAAC
jgi:hypothetical protein